MTTLQEKHKITIYDARVRLLDADLLEEAMFQISVSFDIMQRTTVERVETVWWPMFLEKMQGLYTVQNERFEQEVLATMAQGDLVETRTRQQLEAQFDAMSAPFG